MLSRLEKIDGLLDHLQTGLAVGSLIFLLVGTTLNGQIYTYVSEAPETTMVTTTVASTTATTNSTSSCAVHPCTITEVATLALTIQPSASANVTHVRIQREAQAVWHLKEELDNAASGLLVLYLFMTGARWRIRRRRSRQTKTPSYTGSLDGIAMDKQPVDASPPSSRLTITLAIIGAFLAVLGLVISGDFVRPWTTPYFPGLGYAIVDVGVGALLVFAFVERLISTERKHAQERENRLWDTVRDKVSNLISTQLAEIASEMINVTSASQPSMVDPGATDAQLEEQERKAVLKEMQTMAIDTKLLRERVEHAALNLLDRGYGDLFAQRAEKLGDLQRRYWSHLLAPTTVAYLIDLEQALQSLDLHTQIVARQRKNPTQGMLARLSVIYVDAVYNDVQAILKLIINGVNENLVRIP